jgi:hypothetical protein
MHGKILKYMTRMKLDKRWHPRRTALFRSAQAASSAEPACIRQTEMARTASPAGRLPAEPKVDVRRAAVTGRMPMETPKGCNG